VSGHTLKHLAAAAASLAILRLLQTRRPIAPWFLGWSGRSEILVLGQLFGFFAWRHAAARNVVEPSGRTAMLDETQLSGLPATTSLQRLAGE
jgi:hypothetical protein